MNLQRIMAATPLHHRLNGFGRTIRAERGVLIPATRLRLRRIRFKDAASTVDMFRTMKVLEASEAIERVVHDGWQTWKIIYRGEV